jgi:hypothetical protein
MMRRVPVALGVGLAALAILLVFVLRRAPLVPAGTNGVPTAEYVELKHGGVATCQQVASIPRGTSAIRIAIEARAVGPAVSVAVLAAGRVLSRGSQPPGWGTAPAVTVGVDRLVSTVDRAHVCTSIGPSVEPVRVYGSGVSHSSTATGLIAGTALHMEYLRSGPHRWWSLASATAHRMGLGRAGSGAWIALLALALMLLATVLASRLMLRELP